MVFFKEVILKNIFLDIIIKLLCVLVQMTKADLDSLKGIQALSQSNWRRKLLRVHKKVDRIYFSFNIYMPITCFFFHVWILVSLV